jgi:hypothetical protein
MFYIIFIYHFSALFLRRRQSGRRDVADRERGATGMELVEQGLEEFLEVAYSMLLAFLI